MDSPADCLTGRSLPPNGMMISGLRRLMLHAALAACVLLPCGVAQAAGDILVSAASGELWGATRRELAEGTLKGAKYKEVDERTYRFLGAKQQEGDKSRARKEGDRPSGNPFLTVAGIPTRDVTLIWDEELLHVQKAYTTIYNKGDDGALDKSTFDEVVKLSMDAISDILEEQPKVRKIDKKDAGVKPRAWVWQNDHCSVLLEAHATGAGKRYSSEFIRLTIVQVESELERGGADDAARRADLKQNVRKDKEGSVWIDGVPMVDQGEKGYCVPAAIARVFAYYNMDGVDQHALAAICKSSGVEGTTIESMNKALSSIASRFHVGVSSWRWFNMKDFEKYVQKKRLAPEELFNPKARLLYASEKQAAVRKGLKDIRKYIDAGIPVVWGVMLGLFPEDGLPQAAGGHMRLIIGYNEPLQMIIYTDSWGAGHELKAMPVSQAYAISAVLYVLRPLR